jgi:hypothetical protein
VDLVFALTVCWTLSLTALGLSTPQASAKARLDRCDYWGLNIEGGLFQCPRSFLHCEHHWTAIQESNSQI